MSQRYQLPLISPNPWQPYAHGHVNDTFQTGPHSTKRELESSPESVKMKFRHILRKLYSLTDKELTGSSALMQALVGEMIYLISKYRQILLVSEFLADFLTFRNSIGDMETEKSRQRQFNLLAGYINLLVGLKSWKGTPPFPNLIEDMDESFPQFMLAFTSTLDKIRNCLGNPGNRIRLAILAELRAKHDAGGLEPFSLRVAHERLLKIRYEGPASTSSQLEVSCNSGTSIRLPFNPTKMDVLANFRDKIRKLYPLSEQDLYPGSDEVVGIVTELITIMDTRREIVSLSEFLSEMLHFWKSFQSKTEISRQRKFNILAGYVNLLVQLKAWKGTPPFPDLMVEVNKSAQSFQEAYNSSRNQIPICAANTHIQLATTEALRANYVATLSEESTTPRPETAASQETVNLVNTENVPSESDILEQERLALESSIHTAVKQMLSRINISNPKDGDGLTNRIREILEIVYLSDMDQKGFMHLYLSKHENMDIENKLELLIGFVHLISTRPSEYPGKLKNLTYFKVIYSALMQNAKELCQPSLTLKYLTCLLQIKELIGERRIIPASLLDDVPIEKALNDINTELADSYNIAPDEEPEPLDESKRIHTDNTQEVEITEDEFDYRREERETFKSRITCTVNNILHEMDLTNFPRTPRIDSDCAQEIYSLIKYSQVSMVPCQFMQIVMDMHKTMNLESQLKLLHLFVHLLTIMPDYPGRSSNLVELKAIFLELMKKANKLEPQATWGTLKILKDIKTSFMKCKIGYDTRIMDDVCIPEQNADTRTNKYSSCNWDVAKALLIESRCDPEASLKAIKRLFDILTKETPMRQCHWIEYPKPSNQRKLIDIFSYKPLKTFGNQVIKAFMWVVAETLPIWPQDEIDFFGGVVPRAWLNQPLDNLKISECDVMDALEFLSIKTILNKVLDRRVLDPLETIINLICAGKYEIRVENVQKRAFTVLDFYPRNNSHSIPKYFKEIRQIPAVSSHPQAEIVHPDDHRDAISAPNISSAGNLNPKKSKIHHNRAPTAPHVPTLSEIMASCPPDLAEPLHCQRSYNSVPEKPVINTSVDLSEWFNTSDKSLKDRLSILVEMGFAICKPEMKSGRSQNVAASGRTGSTTTCPTKPKKTSILHNNKHRIHVKLANLEIKTLEVILTQDFATEDYVNQVTAKSYVTQSLRRINEKYNLVFLHCANLYEDK